MLAERRGERGLDRATNLLWLETGRDPDSDIPHQIRVDIRAVRLGELKTLQAIGTAPLYDSPRW